MARRPRPVNPDEGPVQAFAFDLRALRESAGNPTYRALARIAGYSATTLGDAAGGVQLPTLEVTAAYVGACGGDVEAWRTRWQEVNRELACERDGEPEQESEQEPEDLPTQDADPTPVPEPPGQPSRDGFRRSGPWIAVSALSIGIAVVAVIAAFVLRQPPANAAASPSKDPSTRVVTKTTAKASASASQCPTVPSPGTAVAFTGTTYGLGANVRDGASLESAVRFRIPAGCSVGFSGYCLGDVVMDQTADTPDMRWFIIPGVGEVSSAIVHGDPPSSLTARPCPDDVPGPASISLAVAPSGTGGGVLQLSATGSQLWIVGFAAYYADAGTTTAPRWHQFGFGDEQSAGAFSSSPLRLDDVSAATVPVVAVACVGGDGPTHVVAAGSVRPSAPRTLLALPGQPSSMLAEAERTACEYPGEETAN